MELLLGLSQPAPDLLWGLISRAIGFTFLIAFLSIRPQVLAIAGRDGLLPIDEALRAQARDFPSWRRFFYFPTLLWLRSTDSALRALTWLGIAASASAIVGGPHAAWAFALCFVVYLSLDRALTLIYPWDSMLLEAGFWAVFLPATRLLPELACASAPAAPVAWAFRLLAFRVLFGFGKHKFAGARPEDGGFLHGFLVTQPLPTVIGWYAHKLPLTLLKLALLGLFAAEIILPFAAFWPGVPATLAALASIGLMLGIWSTGNFGHFNLILIVVVASWLDHATARQLSLASLATPVGGVFLLHTSLALLSLPFNSFSSFTWTLWPLWRRAPRPLAFLVGVARWLAPLRLVHPYGVFPPNSPPPARFSPVAEVTWDGSAWHELSHPYWPTRESSPLRFCAPHHERFDQAIVYEALGLNEQSVYRGATGRWDPYGYGGVPAAQRLLQRILAGTAPGRRFYDRSLERRWGAPRELRVRTHMLEPVSRAERASRGVSWRRTLVGPHFPPQRLGDVCVEHPLPPPELWHFEDVYWLERSRLGRAMARVARGEDPHRWVADAAPELDATLIDRFWRELAPWVRDRHRDSFHGLRQSVRELRARYEREQLYAFERLAGRYAALLFARLEPRWNRAGLRQLWGAAAPRLGVSSIFQLRLLTYHIVCEGRAAYDSVIADPETASEHAAQLSMFSGHALLAHFRYEALVYQSQKLRLLDVIVKVAGRPELSAKQQAARERIEAMATRAFGALAAAEFLKTQFATDEDVLDIPETWPCFAFSPSGRIVRVMPEEPPEQT